jgi:hypothetical protein
VPVIELRAGTRIWLAAGVNDMRRGDLVRVLWFDGDSLCLFAKRLERGRFIWPQAGYRVSVPCAVVDVARRYRLATAGAHLRAADGCLGEA